MAGKRAEYGSYLEEIEQMWTMTNPHHFLIMYIWDPLSGNANRIEQFVNSTQRCLNHVFLLERENITGVAKTSRKDDGLVLRHGRTRSKKKKR